MELSLKEHRVGGTVPIRNLKFCNRFLNEANVLDMSQAQAHLALRKFLQGFSQEQYEAVNQPASAEEVSIPCWPEAVKCLLLSYETISVISEEMLGIKN